MRLKFKFLVTQSGTSDPVLTILNESDSDYMGTPVASRPSEGKSALTWSDHDLFVGKRVYFKPFGATSADSRNGIINGTGVPDNQTVYWNTVDIETGLSADELLKDTYGEVIMEDI